MSESRMNARVRFNWGFWDGLADHDKKREHKDMSKHPDSQYAAGYTAGYLWLYGLKKPESSDVAWNTYLGDVEERDPGLAGELAAASDAVMP